MSSVIYPTTQSTIVYDMTTGPNIAEYVINQFTETGNPGTAVGIGVYSLYMSVHGTNAWGSPHSGITIINNGYGNPATIKI